MHVRTYVEVIECEIHIHKENTYKFDEIQQDFSSLTTHMYLYIRMCVTECMVDMIHKVMICQLFKTQNFCH